MTKAQIMSKIDKGGVKSSKLIKNNTVEYITNEGTRIIRLYSTNIIMFHPYNAVELNTGGHYTVTTKARMNEFTTLHIFQKAGRWYINDERLPFKDGIIVTNSLV